MKPPRAVFAKTNICFKLVLRSSYQQWMHRLETCMSLSDAVLRFSTGWVTGKSAAKRTPHVIKPGAFPKFVHLYCSNVNWPRLLCFFSQRPHQWSGFWGLAQQCGMNGTFRGLLTGSCVFGLACGLWPCFQRRAWKQDAQTMHFAQFLLVRRSVAIGPVKTGRRRYWNEGAPTSPPHHHGSLFFYSVKAKPNHNLSALLDCAGRVNTFPRPHPVGMFDIERKA